MAAPLRDGGLQLRPFSAGVSIATDRRAQRAVNAAAQRVRLCVGNPARLRSSKTFATAATAADEVRCHLCSSQRFRASEPSFTAGRFFFFGRIQTPPGCSRYQVNLTKPLGLVLEESKAESVVVAEILEGGNAEKCGQISVGDQLISTSGIVYTTKQKYGGTTVRGGEQIVQLNIVNESFDAVLAAIGSHPAHVPVKLEFQRCGEDV